jgi:large subunit ribosomal protein L9
VARSQVSLAIPIKTVGVHPVSLNLHAEVAVSITVNVARSDDEAARQAKGEDLTVQGYGDDEDDAVANAAAAAAAFAPAEGEADDVTESMADETERQRDA